MEDTGDPPPGAWLSMLAGSWGHKALAAWLNGDDFEEVLKPYEAISRTLGIDDDRRGYNNLLAILRAYTAYRVRDILPFDLLDPKTTEVSFVVPLGDVATKEGERVAVDLIGYIDKLVRDRRTGRVMPLEHKFVGQLNDALAARFADYDQQTTAYILAAEGVLGEECDTAWVNAIEVAKVPSSERKCPKHGVPYSECGPLADIRDPHLRSSFISVRRDKADKEEFKKLALATVRDFILPVATVLERRGTEAVFSAPREGPFTGACDYCEYRRWCRTNRRSRSAFATMLRASTIDDSRLRSGFVVEK